MHDLIEFIRTEHAGESGIVYCMLRAGCEKTAAGLCEAGIRALTYHAGMSTAEHPAAGRCFVLFSSLLIGVVKL